MLSNSKICVLLGSLLAIIGVLFLLYKSDDISVYVQGHRINRFTKHAGHYVMSSVERESDDGSFSVILKWKPGILEKELKISPVLKDLRATFKVDANNECEFKITNFEDSRFQLPENEPFPFTKQKQGTKSKESNLFETEISRVGQKFYFELRRKQTQEIIFSTRNHPIYFTDKYLEISTNLDESMIFGLGDRRTDFIIKSGKYSFWTSDAVTIDDGQPGKQLYGFHPMYLRRDVKNNQFHVTLFRNAYGHQVDYKQNSHLTYKCIGGNIDFKFFIGDSNPETSIKLYHNYINGWALHPFWVQGFHQCRWGYKNSEQLMDVWNNYNKYSIPLDSLWTDIDYMYKYQDFTIDFEKFNLQQMQQIYNLSDPYGVHWSSIVDVGIALESDAAYRGLDMNVFIQSGRTNKTFIGKVWPGETYFPDFNHPNSTDYWYEGLKNLTSFGLQQDGIWIDMNEFDSFVSGEIIPNQTIVDKILDYLAIAPPSLPFNPLGMEQIDHKTLSLSAKHYSGENALLVNATNNYTITQYDIHNLNGFGEGLATYRAAKKLGRNLIFILSRSTMFGSGRYVQHWNGDADSTWEYMRYSIPAIMNYNMYGIPFNGDDICGLFGDVTAELCARWQQLGSLYPFSRNHNGDNSISQEPYAFPDSPYVLSSTIKTLNIRYQLLKFYYHLFVRANGTGTIFRPLFWQYPADNQAYQQDMQFMIGDYLMAAPVMEQGDESQQVTYSCFYVPQNAIFYDFYNQTQVQSGKYCQNISFDAVLPLYIRAGKIVHIQDKNTVLRSRFLDNIFTLMIALNEENLAQGSILTINDYNYDENIISNCQESGDCVANILALGQFKQTNIFELSLQVESESKNTNYQTIYVDKLIVSGISLNGETYSKTVYLDQNPFAIDRDGLSYKLEIQL
ncbi:hypothetical protein ABPG72_021973 [Tetrahymena utriculariae]